MSITIPPAALEAGAKVLADINGWRDESGLIACMPVALLCFIAMLEAWEGAKTVRDDGRRQTYVLPALILPLPQEITLNAQDISALDVKSTREEISDE